MTSIYLIRHGETEWNKISKVQGQIDIELSENGVRQAKLLAKRLSMEKIDAIYASNLKRARQTAAIIAEYHKHEILEREDIREISLGPWEGLTVDEIRIKYSEHYRVYREDPFNFNMPGAETFTKLADRTYNAIVSIVKENTDKTIIVVSHGNAIKAAIMRILDIDIKHYTKFRISNASISVVNFYESGAAINSLNNTEHLR